MLEDTRRHIAALPQHPGYVALLSEIQAEAEALTAKLEQEQDPQKAMSMLRVWQVTRAVLGSLRYHPEAVAESIRLEEAREAAETSWFTRQEDPFSRRAPIAPVYTPPQE